jgi:Nucleoside 2-deoxyribosyltransferase like
MSHLQSTLTDMPRQPAASPTPKLAIALMGTCGNSQWREPFKEIAAEHDVFDPTTENWTPDSIFIENQHMMRSHIVVFAITPETDSLISLAEVGVAVAGVKEGRQLLVWIAPECEMANTIELQQRSNSVRTALINHLSQVESPYFILTHNQAQLMYEFTKLIHPEIPDHFVDHG